MSDVFDSVSMFNSDVSNRKYALERILEAKDFDSRLGKRVYISWLERTSADGSLYTMLLDSLPWFHVILATPFKLNRLLVICHDSLLRRLNLSFVLTLSELILRDYVTSNTGREILDSRTSILSIIELWSKKTTLSDRGSDQIEITVLSMVLRMCLLSAFYRDKDFLPAISCLLSLSNGPDYSFKLGALIGRDLSFLIRAILWRRLEVEVCDSENRGDSTFISRAISTRGLAQFGLREIEGRIAVVGNSLKAGFCPIDAMLCLRYCVLRKDFELLNRALEGISTSPQHSLNSMLVYFGFVGPLLNIDYDPRLDARAHAEVGDFILSAICRGFEKHPLFIVHMLEYLVLQLREIRQNRSEWIAERLRTGLPQSAREHIKSVPVVDCFVKMSLEAPPTAELVTNADQPMHEEFHKLVSILKRKRS